VLRRIRNNEAARKSVGAQGPAADRAAAEHARTAHTGAPANQRPPRGSEVRPTVPGRRREPATEDEAMYSCGCGFIFQAAVSTSVGCPHCGNSQAW
jgi:hypothetical protein